ncbi:carbohydrate ABC transporter permease [Microbacterium sp. W4I20]|uniref:carbohydrate ABC transporter permease n=1 Tax=Microbacterium sp. W4I20 TaxID=3042262 RepID=UPI00278AD590|nr:carbohydrate ABC transporter permease [Microbacterium sp. W4I20]MDQ0727908.1 multiple sugar transport system permease protein [Microbacterium sp. W4I20]
MISRPLRTTFRVLALVLGLAYLLPLLWIVLTSFKTKQQVLTEPNGIFFTPTLDTYANVVGDGIGAILTSLQIAIAVTLITLLIAVPAAAALARRVSVGWNRVITVFLAALLVLQMVPQPMTVIPLYSVLASWKLLGTLGGLIVADIALLLPFAIMLLRPFALAIPSALYEAAELDGAGRWRTFRSLTVPLLSNGILTVVCIVFISAWGEFVYAINFLPQGIVLPVSGLLAQQNSTYSAEWNSLMALAVITSLPLLLLFVVSQRRLIAGLSLGAVK